MCGGGGGSNDSLYYQQEQDRKRKARIAKGEAQLDEMFAALEGKRYAGDPVQSAPVWEEHGQAYLDFANPQLDRQFADARGDLTYALSRAGQTQGSVAGDRRSDLELDYGLRQQDVAQTAQEYENTAKANVASQKQNAYQMLSATANPGAATKAAQASLNALQATPSLSPLGMVFQNATAGLAGAVPAYQSGRQNARINNIVYSRDPNQGSASIVN